MLKFAVSTLVRENPKSLVRTCTSLMKTQLRLQTTAAKIEIDNPSASDELEKARPMKDMPGPKFFKTIRAYFPGGRYYKKDMHETLLEMKAEYGDVMLFPSLFGKIPMVMTFNPKDFETVYRNEGVWPVRDGAETLNYYRTKHRADFFQGTEGLIATRGEKWGSFRSIVNPVLMQTKNVRLYVQKMSQVNREFIQQIRKLRDPITHELPANFEKMINRWTLESVCIVALDKHLGLLRTDNIDPLIEKFIGHVNDFITCTIELEAKPSLWRYLATPTFKRLMNSFDKVLEITSIFINETVQRIEQDKKNGIEKPENEKSVLEKLLKIDSQVAVVMAMDMLMAGVDTTSGSFAGIMLCLAKNPEKQAKLREELLRILPKKDSEFSEKSVNDMSYLRACIKESLRLYPVTVANIRQVQNDVVISGYRVPKGMNVVMFSTPLHFDEKHFSNPHEFIPERWLRTSKDAEGQKCPQGSLRSNNPFVFLPFGFGPRTCIGRRVVEMELELGVARVIRNFNVSYNHPMEKPFRMALINVPNIPLKFQMTDVDF